MKSWRLRERKKERNLLKIAKNGVSIQEEGDRQSSKGLIIEEEVQFSKGPRGADDGGGDKRRGLREGEYSSA